MITKYKNHLVKEAHLYAEIKAIEDKASEQMRKKDSFYYDRIRKLDDEKYEQLHKIELEKTKKVNLLKDDIKLLSDHINKVERILKFIDIYRNKNTVVDPDFKVEGQYHYGERMPLEIIDVIQKEYLCLKIVVAENRKPKNKYSLCVVGKHIFNDDLLRLPKSYGLPISAFCEDVAMLIKEAPDSAPLKKYYEASKHKFIDDLLLQYEAVEQEYNAVQTNFLTDEWITLYLEWKLKYYEEHYSRYTETEEYQQLKAELNSRK